MPIYEYRCEKCGNCFEMLVFSSDEDAVSCPDCASEQVQRQMSCVNAVGPGSKSCSSGSTGFS